MRKQTISSSSESVSRLDEAWLDLERLAKVEVTSESAEHPIESALIPDPGLGWRAAQPGKQTIRLIFDYPLSLGRILLRFEENKAKRTQEFVLRWLPEGDQSLREIVRQQYTFSPPATNQGERGLPCQSQRCNRPRTRDRSGYKRRRCIRVVGA